MVYAAKKHPHSSWKSDTSRKLYCTVILFVQYVVDFYHTFLNEWIYIFSISWDVYSFINIWVTQWKNISFFYLNLFYVSIKAAFVSSGMMSTKGVLIYVFLQKWNGYSTKICTLGHDRFSFSCSVVHTI